MIIYMWIWFCLGFFPQKSHHHEMVYLNPTCVFDIWYLWFTVVNESSSSEDWVLQTDFANQNETKTS